MRPNDFVCSVTTGVRAIAAGGSTRAASMVSRRRRRTSDSHSRAAERYNSGVAIDPRVDIGHVHLKVADIERSLGFYRDVLGFEVQQLWGDQAAFVSAGG